MLLKHNVNDIIMQHFIYNTLKYFFKPSSAIHNPTTSFYYVHTFLRPSVASSLINYNKYSFWHHENNKKRESVSRIWKASHITCASIITNVYNI